MRKTTIAAALLLLAATTAVAQVRTPRVSPKSSLMQSVGLTDITINYNRPGVKGRPIWGALVPYDKVWRTGANEATTIQFSDDVWINGNKLTKGLYSLHTIPTAKDWTVIFNSVAEQWGSYSYDAAKDALRIQVTPVPAEHREWMSFEVPEMTTDTAKIVLRWEKIAVPFTVDTKSTERTLTGFKNAMQPDWRTPFQAASFAFDNKGAVSDADMTAWLDQSLKIQENTTNLWLRARIAERAGNKADAIRYAEAAVAKATPQTNQDFLGEIKRNLENWKK
jgi:hypothetical protein